MNYSPLRYPGGKTRITPLVRILMSQLNMNNITYIEPFVGGGGVALSLLFNDDVNHIVINDYDIAIYSVWYAILHDCERLINLINRTTIDLPTWEQQKLIYNKSRNEYSIELAFATLFLNRTNYSGIIKAGPIGGKKQQSKYKINVRFNKDDIVKKIQAINNRRDDISLYNLDIREFITMVLPEFNNAFIYFDPPYYIKGEELYKNFFTNNDHCEIANLIKSLHQNWMITYDDVPEIYELYKDFNIKRYDLNYSVANKGSKSEIIALSHDFWPNDEILATFNKNIR